MDSELLLRLGNSEEAQSDQKNRFNFVMDLCQAKTSTAEFDIHRLIEA